MTADLSVAYAMRCAATDRWVAARDEYRTSRGAAHVAARAVWWPMVVAAIEDRDGVRLPFGVRVVPIREGASV